MISYAARDIGERLDAKALVAFTQSGDTVRRLAACTPRCRCWPSPPGPRCAASSR
ncbi:pyruvate kinase, alpha/beta domain protein [Mycobacterium kansasii]|uniref:Pyruvate kinase, alpha/beta domain protein n=1 Tax=Mycobacterium kansasii TaxID=1768 RepID=A0A1V3WI54_MYCKA|nr:pyruvate kinase, alpha/beta domain protein [Mycobacterium kansasii]